MTKNKQKSLGSLRMQQKTKPRSPELQGTIRIQRHTLDAISKQLDDDNEVIALSLIHISEPTRPY